MALKSGGTGGLHRIKKWEGNGQLIQPAIASYHDIHIGTYMQHVGRGFSIPHALQKQQCQAYYHDKKPNRSGH